MTSHVSGAFRILVAVGALACAAGNAGAQLKKPTPEQIDKDIKAVVAGGNGRTFALKRLGEYEAPLEDKQKEVAELLMKLVKDSKDYNACRSLAVWATDTELKALIEFLDTGDISKAAVYVYSKKKYPAAAKALAARLADGAKDYKVLTEALVLQGSEAEDDVIPYLSETKKPSQKFALEILTKVGTKKSLDPLNKLVASSKDGGVVTPAKQAIKKIEEREKGDKKKE
ncbi:hypothetical protein [Frigoriglobus tundricola]|uniref:HEAT repeat domain-containing protein n=1 Tax=Frigoriglobus tundricola TaxID=2774151 RepID=A0A6M5YXM4_9BACT|nr:hypothetical protein [Frigoriglobus tundricola]QJW98735.1 hypothetical protein FTUN_6330 [Frigoriglobus tundricola]